MTALAHKGWTLRIVYQDGRPPTEAGPVMAWGTTTTREVRIYVDVHKSTMAEGWMFAPIMLVVTADPKQGSKVERTLEKLAGVRDIVAEVVPQGYDVIEILDGGWNRVRFTGWLQFSTEEVTSL